MYIQRRKIDLFVHVHQIRKYGHVGGIFTKNIILVEQIPEKRDVATYVSNLK